MADLTETPWDDIKIAFYCDQPDKFSQAVDSGRITLPAGWDLRETYQSPIAAFAIFRCEKLPTRDDGNAIRKLAARFKFRKSKPPQPTKDNTNAE